MTYREKVIKGFENCVFNYCGDNCMYADEEWKASGFTACRYFAMGDTVEIPRMVLLDVLALLKAQEPRVMTYDEMMKAEICFLEVKGIEEIDPFIRYEVDDKSYWSSPYTNNEDNPFELLAEQEEYLINARCWTSRPTDEQRKAANW